MVKQSLHFYDNLFNKETTIKTHWLSSFFSDPKFLWQTHVLSFCEDCFDFVVLLSSGCQFFWKFCCSWRLKHPTSKSQHCCKAAGCQLSSEPQIICKFMKMSLFDFVHTCCTHCNKLACGIFLIRLLLHDCFHFWLVGFLPSFWLFYH